MTPLVALLLLLPATAALLQEKPAMSDFQIEDEAAFRQIVPADARVRKIADGFGFTEGPVWIGDRLYFSDIPNSRIYTWSTGAGLGVFRDGSHQTNGNTHDAHGNLISCEHESRVVSITQDPAAGGNRQVLVDRFTHDGKERRFNSPNDAVVRSDGTIWFTDPWWGLPADRREELMEYGGCWVFRYDPRDRSVTPVATDFERPNGLCLSPDKSLLYIADDARRHIRRFRITDQGTLEGGEIFCEIDPGGPDGIRCDAEGRIYSTAGDGVHIFSPEGKLIGQILLPETPANCGFGGADGKTLFMTARKSVYAIDLNVAGAR